MAVPVAEGEFTSNGCIKAWFDNAVSPAALLAKAPADKIVGCRRLAYQVPEEDGGPCARSFEDAFILANPERFPLGDGDVAALAYQHAAEQKKSSFALEHAIEHTDWTVPRYLAEGLRWLAQGNPAPVVPPPAVAVQIVAGLAGVEVNVAEVGDNG